MAVFSDTHFLVIRTPEHDPAETESLILAHGGKVTVRAADDSRGATEKFRVHHVISNTLTFADYARAAELMVPITTPQWIVDLAQLGQKRNYRLYAPLPAPFMDKVVLCIADNLAQGDKEAMYAGVRAFGGQYLDALSRYTTHLVAHDLSNNKLVVAANLRRRDDGGASIHIVLPHWIDACMRQQRHVPEAPYLLTNPAVLQTGRPDFGPLGERAPEKDTGEVMDQNTDAYVAKNSRLLKGKHVFIAGDYTLSEHLRASVCALVKSCGGEVETTFELSHIDVYIGKFREGSQFKACLAAPHIDVASLQWLYHVVTRHAYVAPLASNVLHFPVPADGIPQFKNMRISITGISGDARHYLSTLIVAMGATFTKTLDCNNDFLVCAQRLGEKYVAVKTRWPDVRVVNHLWIEESFAEWQFLDPSALRFAKFGAQTQLLGKARIPQAVLERRWLAETVAPLDIGDSANEECDELEGEVVGHAPATPVIATPPTKSASDPSSGSTPKSNSGSGSKTASRSPTAEATDAKSQTEETEGEVFSPSAGSPAVDLTTLSSPAAGAVRAGRSAKAKASLKLHSDMVDLNQYTTMSKSSRKMKSYMDELEKTATPTKKRKEAVEVEEGTETPEPQVKKSKATKATKEVHLVAIMTGCELILTLGKAEITKLLKVGIQILTDYSPKKPIDTIIAPRIFRSEKFLKSLSKAKRIVHPSYIVDILKRLKVSGLTWEELAKEFNIDHYCLDKVVSIKKINGDLGVAGNESGLEQLLSQDIEPVFSDYLLNLSLNLIGGAELISSILQEHGLAGSKTIKLSAGTRKSGLLSMDDGTTILVAHKEKDKKVVANLEGVTVVEWEWCVKSIFHKEVQGFKDYAFK